MINTRKELKIKIDGNVAHSKTDAHQNVHCHQHHVQNWVMHERFKGGYRVAFMEAWSLAVVVAIPIGAGR